MAEIKICEGVVNYLIGSSDIIEEVKQKIDKKINHIVRVNRRERWVYRGRRKH